YGSYEEVLDLYNKSVVISCRNSIFTCCNRPSDTYIGGLSKVEDALKEREKYFINQTLVNHATRLINDRRGTIRLKSSTFDLIKAIQEHYLPLVVTEDQILKIKEFEPDFEKIPPFSVSKHYMVPADDLIYFVQHNTLKSGESIDL